MTPLKRPLAMIALAGALLACAPVGAASDVARFGKHEGARFIHDVRVEGCTLTETQWVKQDGGPVLWEETRISLRGAAFLDLMASVRGKGEVVPTTMLDNTKAAENPYASLTLSAPKGTPGRVESLGTRRLAKAMIERSKTTPSPRGTGDSHVFFEAKSVIILFRGNDTAAQIVNLEAAINKEIQRCSVTS